MSHPFPPTALCWRQVKPVRGGALKVTAILLNGWILRSCCYAVLLSCCPAVMLSCCHAVMLSCYHTVMLTCCYAVMLLCCHAVLLSCCHAGGGSSLYRRDVLSSYQPQPTDTITLRRKEATKKSGKVKTNKHRFMLLFLKGWFTIS